MRLRRRPRRYFEPLDPCLRRPPWRQAEIVMIIRRCHDSCDLGEPGLPSDLNGRVRQAPRRRSGLSPDGPDEMFFRVSPARPAGMYVSCQQFRRREGALQRRCAGVVPARRSGGLSLWTILAGRAAIFGFI